MKQKRASHPPIIRNGANIEILEEWDEEFGGSGGTHGTPSKPAGYPHEHHGFIQAFIAPETPKGYFAEKTKVVLYLNFSPGRRIVDGKFA